MTLPTIAQPLLELFQDKHQYRHFRVVHIEIKSADTRQHLVIMTWTQLFQATLIQNLSSKGGYTNHLGGYEHCPSITRILSSEAVNKQVSPRRRRNIRVIEVELSIVLDRWCRSLPRITGHSFDPHLHNDRLLEH